MSLSPTGPKPRLRERHQAAPRSDARSELLHAEHVAPRQDTLCPSVLGKGPVLSAGKKGIPLRRVLTRRPLRLPSNPERLLSLPLRKRHGWKGLLSSALTRRPLRLPSNLDRLLSQPLRTRLVRPEGRKANQRGRRRSLRLKGPNPPKLKSQSPLARGSPLVAPNTNARNA